MEIIIRALGVFGGMALVYGALINGKEFHGKKQGYLFLGACIMLAYTSANFFFLNGAWQYILMQAYACSAGILGLMRIPDKINVPITLFLGIVVSALSLGYASSVPDYIITFGIVGISIGYVFNNNLYQNIFLCIGSLFVIAFSYMVSDWIFFFLNILFAVFSAYYITLFWSNKE